jgi:hypothetical protein
MTTAARPPQLDISLDTLPALTSLRDYQRGDAAIVRTIEAQQHALMCGWGTPPQCFSFAVAVGQGEFGMWYIDFPLRVPPFCTRFRVAALMAGYVEFQLQVGSLAAMKFTSTNYVSDPSTTWVEGSATESLGNETGFMQAVATQAATWQTVVVRASNLGFYFSLQALAFYPLLEQAV